MLAYQMIYTACGKDKSGAFSVWAKSQEVSKQECDEIVKLMNYKKPRNAPYDPTPEEIKRLFPQKYAFFDLSTGRKCIAQSSYIGNVYSELDGRSGNFIIHAYVFDKLENINPFFIFDSSDFKSELTYKEWHDDPVPDVLPAVDIDITINANNVGIQTLLSTIPSDGFPMLLESVIACTETDGQVIFVDSEEKQILLYKAMGLLLPKTIVEKATFSTQYSTQSEFAIQSIGGVPVKIRNIFESGVPNSVNLQEEIDAGKMVFSFDKELFSKVSIRPYVRGIVEDAKTKSLFFVLNEVEQINKIMNEVPCNINDAYSIYKFINKDYGFFNTLDDFVRSFGVATDRNYVDIKSIAVELYEKIVKTNRFGKGKVVLSLITQLYKVADKQLKEIILIDFFKALNDYIQIDSSGILEQFKETAPFSWDDFVLCVKTATFFKNYSYADSVFSKRYLIYMATLDALDKGIGERAESERAIISIVNTSLQNRMPAEIALLIKEGKKVTSRFELWILNNVLKRMLYAALTSDKDIQFAFAIIGILDDEFKEQALRWLLTLNIKSPYLLPNYVVYAEKEPKLIEKVEKNLSSEDEYKAFFIKKESYMFQNTAQVNPRILENYFNKFYVKGYDNGVYLKKLAHYLSGLSGFQKVNECFRQYDSLSKLPDDFCDVLEIYRLIEIELYKTPLAELLKLQIMQIQKLSQLNEKLIAHKIKPSGKFEILYALAIITRKFGRDQSLQALTRGEIYKGLSSQQLSFLEENHIEQIIEFYLTSKKESRLDTTTLLQNIFVVPFKVSYGFDNCLIRGLESLNDKDYYQMMADFMTYAFCQKDNFAVALKSFVVKYIDTLKKSEYKKLFKKVQELLDDRTFRRVEPFIDDYLEQHKGFFEKLFGKKKKED